MTQPIYLQRYRAKRRLPAGRAEAAYRGEDDQGRPVTVTVLRPVDPDGFLRTIGLVSAVRHLDVAPVIDAGRDGADCFVVTEDPGGVDATRLVARGPLAPADAALIGAEAAAGLTALHERGAVHGGITPATVVQGGDGVVKLTGAGLAGGYPPPDMAADSDPEVARYLSPEEVAGRVPSAASDVYRLGLVTYLLLTGGHALDGVDGRAVAQEQLNGVVHPPQLVNSEVPPALAQIVMRALEKDPGARGTAAQYQNDIERVLGSAQVQVVPQKPQSKVWIWVVAALVVVVAAVIAAWALGVFGSGSDVKRVKVPEVTGMSAAGAGRALAQAGLTAGKVTEVQSTEGPQGTVVTQSPFAGVEVDEGSAVALEVVASPPPTPASAAIPGVVGVSESAATASLTGVGFVVVAEDEPSETVAAGLVISQEPSAGVVAAQGTNVRIAVSTGPPTPTTTPSP